MALPDYVTFPQENAKLADWRGERHFGDGEWLRFRRFAKQIKKMNKIKTETASKKRVDFEMITKERVR